MADEKVEKVEKKYYCECCDYLTYRKEHFNKHLLTAKHKYMQKSQKWLTTADEKVEKVENVEKVETENFQNIQTKELTCICGKSYKHRQSLFKHQQKCNYKEPVCEERKSEVSNELVLKLLEKLDDKDKMLISVVNENTELTKKMVEIAPNMGNNNNNTINNNQKFNINVFLNEECKDAINMSDFLKSIEVSFEQLDYTKVNGLEKGITKVIMDNLNKLSKYERPIHCTDMKRETIYIKDDDRWEKDKDKEMIKKVINKTSNKNYTALVNWKDENPNFMNYDEKQAYFARTISNIGKPISGVEDKIIKTLCKENYVKAD